jgi:predicted nucleic acid-binding protein
MSAKSLIYIETSVISYLTARPSRAPQLLSWQRDTSAWWALRGKFFDPIISDVVLREARQGDPEPAARRLEALKGIEILPDTQEARALANRLLAAGGLPKQAEADALHLAVCAVNCIPLLVTWNFRHIANEHQWAVIKFVCEQAGHAFPVISNPTKLLLERSFPK